MFTHILDKNKECWLEEKNLKQKLPFAMDHPIHPSLCGRQSPITVYKYSDGWNYSPAFSPGTSFSPGVETIILLAGYTSGSFTGKFVIVLLLLNLFEWALQENWRLLFIVARTPDKSFLTFEIARGYREWLKESRWIIGEEFFHSAHHHPVHFCIYLKN